jgi:hypothetical protein
MTAPANGNRSRAILAGNLEPVQLMLLLPSAANPGLALDILTCCLPTYRLQNVNLAHVKDNMEVRDALVATSTLDNAQAWALLTGLSQELAVVQGPPGTGEQRHKQECEAGEVTKLVPHSLSTQYLWCSQGESACTSVVPSCHVCRVPCCKQAMAMARHLL